MGTYSFSGTVQTVVIQQSGVYDITGYGGAGGGSRGTIAYGTHSGGQGAEVGGYFNLTAGEVLKIVAGGAGATSNSGGGGGGGGGATTVLANIGPNGTFVPLLVAGGGGGAGQTQNGVGADATVGAGVGGMGGGGGGHGGGGGGAGAYANGNNGGAFVSFGATFQGGTGGADYAAGGAGGTYTGTQNHPGKGGFGGAGSGGVLGGGGGGGYTGGNGGYSNQAGGYGTSLDKGTPIAAQTVSAENGGAGKVNLTFVSAVCYVSGTRIRTTRGDVAVEALAVGDIAVTSSGISRPIVWIGRRDVDCTALEAPHDSWPVRILAGAFGVGPYGRDLPGRDLWLSPGHPVLVGSGSNEHLVPIMCLINGTSIARMPVERLTYWHIELDAHDILLAEGLPAESFLDYGNRPWFGSDAEAHALTNPDFIVPGLGARCRPVAIDGPIVETERRRLDALFAMRLAANARWPCAADVSLGV